MTRISISLLLAGSCLLPFGNRALAEPTDEGLFAGFLTSMGEFWCRLEFEKAPRTVANFVSLAEGTREWIDFDKATVVKQPFYNGITFHRVVPNFVIQAGSRNGQGTDGPGYSFADEFHAELRHSGPGVLSMANSGPDSNGSQFFLTLGTEPALDDLYSVFGVVVEGMEVVQAISEVETNSLSQPVTPVVLNEVRIVRNGAEAEAFDPAAVQPPPPGVGVVPSALLVTTNSLNLLLQARSNHLQHVFFTTNLTSWQVNTFRGYITNLAGDSLLEEFSHGFFRVLDGGFEP